MEFYRRKQKVVTVRHVSDDEIVAMVEIVSPTRLVKAPSERFSKKRPTSLKSEFID